MEFVTIEKDHFSLGRQPVFFRGIGVGSWLNLEHYELGVPGWESDIYRAFQEKDPGFPEKFRRHFFREEDAGYIRSLGLNLIRVPVNHHLFWDEETDRLAEDGLRWLQYLSDICGKTGLYYLLDLHTAPGGQNPDWHSESPSGRSEFWHYAVFRKRTVAVWQFIVAHCANDPMLLGYDLLNEPVLQGADPETLNQFYADTILAIRKQDPHHIVFLEGNHFAMDYRGVRLPEDPQVTFTFHFYPSVWEPAVLELEPSACGQALQASLDRILCSMETLGRPVICGETGFEHMKNDPEKWTRVSRQVLEALEARGAGWCLWNYKDTGAIGLTVPRPDTPWMRMTHRIGSEWDHHRAEKLGYELADLAGNRSGYQLLPEEQYRLQFILRAALAQQDVGHILQPALAQMSPQYISALPESFRFENCQVVRPMERLLKDMCDRGGMKNDET